MSPEQPADRPDSPLPGASGGDPSQEQPGDEEAGPPPEAHDDAGLDLARSVARGLARPGARRPAARGSGRGRSPRRATPQVSGAHPDERDPQLLDSTIGRLIDEQGWATDVRVHGVFSRWDTVVGREVSQHCRPESFERADGGGTLVVRTDSTAWATQMRLLAATVVRRLNEELGDATVGVIDVRGPQGPSWKRGPRSVRDGRGPRDTYG